MPIFSFVGHTLPEFLKKSWQIYEQTNETFYTSNDVRLQNNMLKRKTILAVHRSTNWNKVLLKFRKIHRKTTVPESLFLIKLQSSGLFFQFSRTLFLQNTSGRPLPCAVAKRVRNFRIKSVVMKVLRNFNSTLKLNSRLLKKIVLFSSMNAL